MALKNTRIILWLRTLLAADLGAAQATSSDVPVVAAADENGIMWTRDAGALLPPATAGAAGSQLRVFDTPAAAIAPDADAPAPGATLSNVIDTLAISLNAVAAQVVLLVVIRDGATGAGTILWSIRIGPLAAATSQLLSISGLNIRGSDNTEMTVETTTAPAATNFASIAWTGRIVNS
ncbi:MAG: hypothetical protein ACREUY_01190 [Burkholderiales bacterium]